MDVFDRESHHIIYCDWQWLFKGGSLPALAAGDSGGDGDLLHVNCMLYQ